MDRHLIFGLTFRLSVYPHFIFTNSRKNVSGYGLPVSTVVQKNIKREAVCIFILIKIVNSIKCLRFNKIFVIDAFFYAQ